MLFLEPQKAEALIDSFRTLSESLPPRIIVSDPLDPERAADTLIIKKDEEGKVRRATARVHRCLGLETRVTTTIDFSDTGTPTGQEIFTVEGVTTGEVAVEGVTTVNTIPQFKIADAISQIIGRFIPNIQPVSMD